MRGTLRTMTMDNKLKGLGTDIIEIERIRQSIERHGAHFLNRLFSQKEQDYCLKYKDPAPHFAGRFAAKEAVAKAFGTGFGKEISWHDLEIITDKQGKPHVHVSDALKKRFQDPHILISISHSNANAIATAIWN